ncbi:hypothetical protein [Niallia taxi]|uniref:hypothetical protein n=1 Tax=Niallia taxi TaxID=2499688 RepID=UPI0015F5BBCD|nr:hypothetical protein [Niallia taxi]
MFVHKYLLDRVVVLNLTGEILTEFAQLDEPIYVETPLAYWKIYKSPLRSKLVVDHLHKKSNALWHNQGFCVYDMDGFWSAIDYIKRHDWFLKNRNKNPLTQPLVIYLEKDYDEWIDWELPEQIYCLTSSVPIYGTSGIKSIDHNSRFVPPRDFSSVSGSSQNFKTKNYNKLVISYSLNDMFKYLPLYADLENKTNMDKYRRSWNPKTDKSNLLENKDSLLIETLKLDLDYTESQLITYSSIETSDTELKEYFHNIL